ncbi:hypothetical protein [uncultured Duodenibacillus sp.]|uniref:hypothetical protein n=1 Tax=uncultured Duodenibacillus sp. TaxID=1980699 RepID=UPI000ECABC09|nr:hypothetical protein [uncultured Duodenibacillus sp.]HAF65579.1 hypothetical protein [Sutterella sp.]
MKAFSFSLPRIARSADFLQFCVWLALLFFAVIALVPPEGVDMSLARLFYKVTDGAWVRNAFVDFWACKFVARPADKTQRARAPEVPRLPAARLLSYRHRADRKRSGCGGAAQPDGFLKQQLLRVQTSFLPFTQSIE